MIHVYYTIRSYLSCETWDENGRHFKAGLVKARPLTQLLSDLHQHTLAQETEEHFETGLTGCNIANKSCSNLLDILPLVSLCILHSCAEFSPRQ